MKQYLITEKLNNQIIDVLSEGKLKDNIHVFLELRKECASQPSWEIKKEKENESNK